ncbi:MAG: hypothetical protein J6Q22_08085 [Prevotella sp.]|nr:hypothetical protein [Prevotella sp.]
MKVIRKLKGLPNGATLNISVQYGLSDVKAALIDIKTNRLECGTDTISMERLTTMLVESATDPHMPKEQRRYIAEWMARRSVAEGFVFRTNDYLGNADSGTDVYLIDEDTIRENMRGRRKKKV